MEESSALKIKRQSDKDPLFFKAFKLLNKYDAVN